MDSLLGKKLLKNNFNRDNNNIQKITNNNNNNPVFMNIKSYKSLIAPQNSI